MENASKALIIAGAILLSILLIGMGVFIYNQASSTMKNINMNEQEIMAFNSKFEQYFGSKVSGSNVMALCDLVRTSNNASEDATIKQVTISYKSAANTDITAIKSSIVNGKVYKVTGKTYSKAGLIEAITIEDVI